MDFKTSVSEKIVAYCKNTDCSQAELAEKIGVSGNTVSKWVNMTAVIGGDKLRLLAEVMGMSVDYLSGSRDIEPGDEAREITALSDILKIDLLNGTLTIPSSLVEYLKGVKLLEESIAQGIPEEIRSLAIAGLQAKYNEKRGKGFDVTYTLYKSTGTAEPPKDYLDGPVKAAMMRNTPGPR